MQNSLYGCPVLSNEIVAFSSELTPIKDYDSINIEVKMKIENKLMNYSFYDQYRRFNVKNVFIILINLY